MSLNIFFLLFISLFFFLKQIFGIKYKEKYVLFINFYVLENYFIMYLLHHLTFFEYILCLIMLDDLNFKIYSHNNPISYLSLSPFYWWKKSWKHTS